MTTGILIDVGKSLTSVVGSAISIDLDVSLDEVHEMGSDVTTNNVETGSVISDHIQLLPDRVTITGMITDAPISPDVSARFGGGIDGAITLQRVQSAFDVLRAMHEKRELITLYTKHRIYADMAITGISIPRGTQDGEAIRFTMQLVKVRMVSTQTTRVPPGISAKPQKLAGGKKGSTSKKAQAQKDAGRVPNKPIDDKTTILEKQYQKATGQLPTRTFAADKPLELRGGR